MIRFIIPEEYSQSEPIEQCSNSYIKSEDETSPKRFYFGKEARDDIGSNLSDMYKGWIISKRLVDENKPYSLKSVAADYIDQGKEAKDIVDLYYILEALEGMCHNNEAVEVSDGFYYVGSFNDWKNDKEAREKLAEIK